jgi:hypothetical protein
MNRRAKVEPSASGAPSLAQYSNTNRAVLVEGPVISLK